MGWTFERVFFGRRQGLDLSSLRAYLGYGFYPLPNTLFEGAYRTVHRVGDHDGLCFRIEKPFPDAVIAQKPAGRFALHFSGGFDSAILAKLYDSEQADYIHFTGPESVKARALAATLKGRLHEIRVTPELFLQTAEEILPRLAEPYAFEDVVFAYIASRKAKELGHGLVVTGDGGDVIFGGFTVGPDSMEAADIWKTLEPNRLLGLESFQPLAHRLLLDWSNAALSPSERGFDKLFARRYCRELGLPEEVVSQRKIPWASSLGVERDGKVVRHMSSAVAESGHRWIREFSFPSPPKESLLFRQYSLVRWLEANYGESPAPREIDELARKVRELNVQHAERRPFLLKQAARLILPSALLKLYRKARRRPVPR